MSARDDLLDEYGHADTAPLGTLSELKQKLDAYRVEVLIKAGVQYEDCTVCGAAHSVGKPCGTCEFNARMAAEAGVKATPEAAPATEDTFPAWLAQRFDPNSPPWDVLDHDGRTYWQHEAAAVRRAVARGGFKTDTTTGDNQ